jgi:hypothetical protein
VLGARWTTCQTERHDTPFLRVMVLAVGCVATSGVGRSEQMRREPASFSMTSHFLQKGAEPMSDTVDPIGIVGAGRVAQTLGRLLS